MKYIVKSIYELNDKKLQEFSETINKEKRKRIEKYINSEAKRRSILGEYLVQKLLKEEKIDLKKLKIETNKNGKPYFKNSKIYYNISHSHEYVAAAISDNKVGIDIEKIRNISLKTINQFATDREKDFILSEENKILKRFFELYTLKESYIKMKGLTLAQIKEAQFEIKNNTIKCNDESVIARLVYDIPNYVIAICEQK